MKKLILLAMFSMALMVESVVFAKAAAKGETAQPVQKRVYTYE